MHRLRRAGDGDRERVEALLSAEALPLDGVAEAYDRFVVAELEGAGVVGAVGLEAHGQYGLLRSAVVAPEWRGGGLGRELALRVLADARAEGRRAVYLLTTTAAEFFEGLGFRRIERRQVPADLRASPEFRGACPDTATVMMKELG